MREIPAAQSVLFFVFVWSPQRVWRHPGLCRTCRAPRKLV